MIDKNLEEAAEEFTEQEWDGLHDDGGNALFSEDCIQYAFKAGAEWQKEQDQPITGNSLEKEWLRYVNKKKKECRGELPALGEYGWLQIARHFAEWQKSQMLGDAVKGKVNQDGFLELSNGEVIDICPTLKRCALGLHIGDKVRIIVIKAEEESK